MLDTNPVNVISPHACHKFEIIDIIICL